MYEIGPVDELSQQPDLGRRQSMWEKKPNTITDFGYEEPKSSKLKSTIKETKGRCEEILTTLRNKVQEFTPLQVEVVHFD